MKRKACDVFSRAAVWVIFSVTVGSPTAEATGLVSGCGLSLSVATRDTGVFLDQVAYRLLIENPGKKNIPFKGEVLAPNPICRISKDIDAATALSTDAQHFDPTERKALSSLTNSIHSTADLKTHLVAQENDARFLDRMVAESRKDPNSGYHWADADPDERLSGLAAEVGLQAEFPKYSSAKR